MRCGVEEMRKFPEKSDFILTPFIWVNLTSHYIWGKLTPTSVFCFILRNYDFSEGFKFKIGKPSPFLTNLRK